MFDRSTRIAIIRRVDAGTPAEPMLLAETWAADPVERSFLGVLSRRPRTSDCTRVWGAGNHDAGWKRAAAEAHFGLDAVGY